MRLLFVILFLLTGTLTQAQFGMYASAVYMNLQGSSTFYNNTAPGLGQDIGSSSFQGTQLGLFQQNSGTLKIVGAEVKTYKAATDNVCAASLYYTVYPLGSRPASPVFNSIGLGFYSDCFAPACGSFFGSFDLAAGGGCCSDRDQKWQNPGFGIAANVDLTNQPIGMYTLELYYDYTGEDAGNGCGTTKYDNNNNNATNYTAGFIIGPVVPVSFGTITVVNNQSFNYINWNTYSEADTKYFSLERSANGIDFLSQGTLSAAGFSSVIKNYNFQDKAPLNGINYYRVKMVDTDSSLKYSKIVSTKNGTKNSCYIVQNPANNNIRVAGIEKNDQLILYNAYGAIIRKMVSVSNEITITAKNLPEANYFIRLINHSGSVVLPVIIRH